MFGHTFFGASYFGPRYFGPAGDGDPPPEGSFTTGVGGGGLTSPRRYSNLSEVYDDGANKLSRWVPTE